MRAPQTKLRPNIPVPPLKFGEGWAMACLCQYLGQSSALPKHALDLRHIGPFRNQSSPKSIGSKIAANLTLLAVVKIRRRVSEMSVRDT